MIEFLKNLFAGMAFIIVGAIVTVGIPSMIVYWINEYVGKELLNEILLCTLATVIGVYACVTVGKDLREMFNKGKIND